MIPKTPKSLFGVCMGYLKEPRLQMTLLALLRSVNDTLVFHRTKRREKSFQLLAE
jgi:hypothetical protein